MFRESISKTQAESPIACSVCYYSWMPKTEEIAVLGFFLRAPKDFLFLTDTKSFASLSAKGNHKFYIQGNVSL